MKVLSVAGPAAVDFSDTRELDLDANIHPDSGETFRVKITAAQSNELNYFFARVDSNDYDALWFIKNNKGLIGEDSDVNVFKIDWSLKSVPIDDQEVDFFCTWEDFCEMNYYQRLVALTSPDKSDDEKQRYLFELALDHHLGRGPDANKHQGFVKAQAGHEEGNPYCTILYAYYMHEGIATTADEGIALELLGKAEEKLGRDKVNEYWGAIDKDVKAFQSVESSDNDSDSGDSM